MTATQISGYLKDTYGECRYDAYAMSKAINKFSKNMNSYISFYGDEYALKWNLFHLLVENKPIPELHTHSYGFHTNNGRFIIEKLKEYYYENISSNNE
jgi:hypothetical protein